MSKFYKHIFSVLVAFALTINLLPALRVNAADEADSGSCGPNLTWSLDSYGLLTISGTGPMDDYTVSNKPPFPMTKIVKVVIDSGVTSIGSQAFSDCSNLTSVTIPKGVTSIGDSAFERCSSLESVTIPEGVTSIGKYAFYGCKDLTSITIPNSVTSIGDSAFYGCSSLTSVMIPDSVTSIGSHAFRGCSSLTSVTISDGVTSIGECAFYGCSSLTSVTIPQGVTSIGDKTFERCSKLESVTIPDSVTSIGTFAFYGCSKLGEVTIPSSVTSIGEGAFVDCSSLDSVVIPQGVTSIGDRLFNSCSSLESVTIPDSVTSIGSYAFYECSKLGEVTIPSSVTSIGGSAFSRCSDLESVTIPKGVTSIGAYTFYSCSSLDSVTIPDSVTSIGESAFDSCSSLTSMTIPENVTSIDSFAFNSCSNLESVEINKDLYDKLDKYVFFNCTKLVDESNFTFRYKVTFVNEDGTKLYSESLKYGDATSYPYSNPEKQADKQYTYTFSGWKDDTTTYGLTDRLPEVTGDITYTAHYTSTVNKYNVNFMDEEGNVLQSGDVAYGKEPEYAGVTPAKEKTDKETYTFSGWTDGTNKYGIDEDLPVVTESVDYKAVFESTTNKYTIEFVDENGKVLQSEILEYGITPSYKGTTPVKAEDDKFTYEFSGWSPVISSVTCDATYKAVFVSNAKPEPVTPSTPTPAPATPVPAPATSTPAAPVPVNKVGTYYLKSMVEQDGDIVFTIKQSEDDSKTYDLLGTVSSDGTKLTEGDQYTSAKGSAIITVKKSYLDTLNAGIHKLTVTFTDGGSITINYEIKAPAQETKPAETKAVAASTGEVIAMTTPAGIVMIIISSCIALTALLRKRREIR